MLAAFVGLGASVGVQAVLLADLAGALRLDPAALGNALSVQAAAGIAAVLAGGRVADRVGRRPLLVAGAGGVGLFVLALAGVGGYQALVVAFVGVGIGAGCFDLAANALGGDFEREYRERAMTRFHAGFSGGAAAGAALTGVALSGGVGYRVVYAGVGLLLVGLGVAGGVLPLPLGSEAADDRSDEPGGSRRGPLRRVQGVGLAILLGGSVSSATGPWKASRRSCCVISSGPGCCSAGSASRPFWRGWGGGCSGVRRSGVGGSAGWAARPVPWRPVGWR